MNLSISNLTWDLIEDCAIADILSGLSLGGVEIAPTKVWPAPLAVSQESISSYRRFWESRGIKIVALQSLLFGRPDLEIFKSEVVRNQTIQYLTVIIELAAHLGARVLVFGSPKNRLVGQLRDSEIIDTALEFFSTLANIAQKHGVCFCIEPNPPHYGCDFIRNATEGVNLVKLVNHPGFRLHLDAGAMIMNDEPLESAIEEGFEWLAHFHISEPNLAVPGQEMAAHSRIARTLQQLDYDKYVSIEMINKTGQSNPLIAQSALRFVMDTYF